MFNLLSNAFKYTPDGKNIDFILEPQMMFSFSKLEMKVMVLNCKK